MHIVDSGLKGNLGQYLVQCALAILTVLGIFFLLDVLLRTSVVSSLGATTFIAFAMPHSHVGRPRSLLGGYLLGTLCGTLCSLAAGCSLAVSTGLAERTRLIIFGALAIGLTILAMVSTDTEHPPAAGLALGFVADPWSGTTILFVLSAVGLLTLAKHLLRRTLIDLV
jgi:CBS-domain-containing membrane protein